MSYATSTLLSNCKQIFRASFSHVLLSNEMSNVRKCVGICLKCQTVYSHRFIYSLLKNALLSATNLKVIVFHSPLCSVIFNLVLSHNFKKFNKNHSKWCVKFRKNYYLRNLS